MSIATQIEALQTDKTNIRNAIINKGGTSASGNGFDDFATDIATIPSGVTPTGTISITENGTHDVTNYASANVNVSGGGGTIAVLEGDFVPTSENATYTVYHELNTVPIFAEVYTNYDTSLLTKSSIIGTSASSSVLLDDKGICATLYYNTNLPGIGSSSASTTRAFVFTSTYVTFGGTNWSYVPYIVGATYHYKIYYEV